MGARPDTFRKGGGFLNNVDGTFVDYEFTDKFNGEAFVPGKNKNNPAKDKFHSLYAVISVLPDGAEEPVTTTLFVGGYDDFEISEDGHVITRVGFDPADPKTNNNFDGNVAFAVLVSSMVAAGFPISDLDEVENDFRPLLGKRYRWVQRTNAEQTKKLGARVDPKTGKSYDRKDLVVDQYYGAAATTAKAGKAAPAKAAGKAKEADLDTTTTDTLMTILGKQKTIKEGPSLHPGGQLDHGQPGPP